MLLNFNCWHCHKKQCFERSVPFREQCQTCGRDLHVCFNCKYYSTGKPNDCSYPNTEPVLDKEKANFCEEFSPLSSNSKQDNKTVEDVSKQLFKDDHRPHKKKSFDDLFEK